MRTLEVRDSSNNYLPEGAEDVAVQADGRIVVTGAVIDGRIELGTSARCAT